MDNENILRNKGIWNSRYLNDWRFNNKFRKIVEETKRKYFTTNIYVDRAVSNEIKARLSEDDSVFDAGCGPSSIMIEKFKKISWKLLIGADISIEGLRLFNKRAKATRKTTSALLLDILYTPLKDESINIVISMSMIEYLSDTQVVLFFDEMDRILKGGGYLILAYPNRDSFLRKKCMDYARKTNLTECIDDTRMYDSVISFIGNGKLRILNDYTVGITSQLFYANYYFKRNRILRMIRPFYSILTIVLCLLFGWLNPFIRRKGDYRITVIQKMS